MSRKADLKLKLFVISLLSLFINSTIIISESKTKKLYLVSKPELEIPIIDGKLDENIWKKANWQSDFIQYEPSEGKEASQKTEFAIFFDEHNIYIGAKCYDNKPDSIVKRITRRDDLDGDAFVIQIDSYFDKRSAFAFGVSASGVKQDAFISNDGNEDSSWDAVWFAKTSADSLGWYVEMRIPLTQLRFEGGENPVWGIQVGRKVFRNDETFLWQEASKKVNGWVSQYGEMKGMTNLKARKILEILPYIVTRLDTYEKEADNPFLESGKSTALHFGVDGKVGLTNNLTLDFTVNPDFGQVEADPSEVNLSSFETFFQEKRPFFVEGKNIFSFQLALGDGSLGNENLFYSRRIGRRPHFSPDIDDNEYEKVPDFTRIIGAAKISGKTKNGWSIGVLESITSNEYASISGTSERKELVEPLTNFTVTRTQKDFNNGNTIIGGMFTSVNRNIADESVNSLNKSAYSGGIDFIHKWHNKDWEINLNTYFSRVNGSTEAITTTQNSSAHNFQRPDATHIHTDSTRTSLTGSGGKFLIGKLGGKLRFLFATTWKSPQLELNDAGYMRIADDIYQLSWASYRTTAPFSIFRTFSVNFNQFSEWNFAGDYLGVGGNINVNTQFKNYWFLGFGGNINAKGLSTTVLRGGPSMKKPGNKNVWMYIESNEQKKLTSFVSYEYSSSDIKSNYLSSEYEVGVEYKPTNSLQLKLSAGYSADMNELQYVDTPEYGNNTDYLFAKLDQRTFFSQVRINYNITPDLSLQYWGQPFVSAGKYTKFKKITNSKDNNYYNRFHSFSNSEISFDEPNNNYSIYGNSPESLYSFDNPDFNVKEFLSNFVLRWEYKPGSTMYLVWSQTRNREDDNGRFGFSENINQLFEKYPYNIFLVKFSYRFGR